MAEEARRQEAARVAEEAMARAAQAKEREERRGQHGKSNRWQGYRSAMRCYSG